MFRTLIVVVVVVFVLNPLFTTFMMANGFRLNKALSQRIQQSQPSHIEQVSRPGSGNNVSANRYGFSDLNQANGILYAQIDGPEGPGIPSQAFGGEYSSYDSKAADDFTIPESDGKWIINSIEVAGSYSESGGPVEVVNIAFYEDDSGQPGTLVYEEKGRQDRDTNRDGYFEIPLAESLTLEHGTYWLSVQASMAYATQGQWYWSSRIELSGHSLMWQNPGDGFESGCVSWQPRVQCNTSTLGEPDALFLLRGITESSIAPKDDNISFSKSWFSSESDWTFAVAWGDVDGDGDLDLAVSNWNNDPTRLYRNDGGLLTSSAVWSAGEYERAMDIAWGDVDGDGDLDLALANDIGRNRLYLNDDGVLTSSAVWSSSEHDGTQSIAWGDVDGDGDLDLAAGNRRSIRLYLNDDGVLTSTAVWSSNDDAGADSIAWGDVDGDGDLDLAVGSSPNRLYRNDDGVFTSSAVWTSSEDDGGRSVAWGDVDGDGNLDLAVGTFGSNRLYHNDDGVLMSTAVWSSSESDPTASVAWGDVDGDGDLDLAVGNSNAPNRLYRNDGGVLTYTAIWSSSESETTESIAWGDVDGDGDLDLALANDSAPNRFYRNEGEILTSTSIWSSGESGSASSIAWGDVDGDGDLDLAAGSSPIRLYRNDDGELLTSAVLSSGESDSASSIAWGDVDGDGDLDLVASSSSIRLYRNDDGELVTSAVWSSSQSDITTSVAWGDVDGDGDLDLAVGNSDDFGAPNRLYRNDGGVLNPSAVWTSSESDWTASIAWGDVDGDGDLDLATGNLAGGYAWDSEGGVPNILYRNDGGVLSSKAAWSSSESDWTASIAWGDVDGDGDLDLATGNRGDPNRLYRNDDGVLTSSAVWSSSESDWTYNIAWGDVDGDGDLDLGVGNGHEPTRLYRNDDGVLTSTAVWSSSESDWTYNIAWGDVDGDGDLDLAVGNSSAPNRLYRNKNPLSIPMENDPPNVVIQLPGNTDAASFFSTPHIISTATIPIEYVLFDPEEDTVPKIFPEFSLNGGGQWLPATPGNGGDGLVDLTASADGVPHTFMWHAEADLIKSDNVVFRIRVLPRFTHSPILWAAVDAKSLPFRVGASQYVKVADERGNVIADSTVYVDGQNIGATDRTGLLNPDEMVDGTSIVALHQIEEHPTVRAAHDNWAYRTYITTLPLDVSGKGTPFAVSGQGEQRLVLSQDAPLILFNIVVSVEWDADVAYLSMLEDAFRKASDYLYDVTDGQMAFGQVDIYDNAEHWSDADFQISAKNTVRPYAYIGGIDSDDTSHAIRVGRFWSGSSGNEGNWNEPDGYRTLIHEFGHYALYLQDEYFVRTTDSDGRFTGRQSAACTGLSIVSDDENSANGSIMYYQYKASELVDKERWNANCQNTEQHRVNGKSDWETVLDHYGGEGWTLNTPSSRGSIMDGPSEFPRHLIPFPEITIHNRGIIQDDVASHDVTVVDPQGEPISNALVALFTTPGEQTIAIDQGLTDITGHITVYGANKNDRIQAASFDGSMAGVTNVGEKNAIELVLEPVSVSAASVGGGQSSPHLSMTPSSDGTGLTIQVNGLPQSSLPLNAFLSPAEGGGSPQFAVLTYSPDSGKYNGAVSLEGVGLGTGKIQVIGGKLAIPIISDYNLQRVIYSEANSLYSEDGNFAMHLPPNSLSGGANGYATILPTGYVPRPLPEGKQVIGQAYEVRLSSANTFVKDALIELTYHPGIMGYTDSAVIHFWDIASQNWQPIGGTLDSVDRTLSATTAYTGIYALLSTSANSHKTYLPSVLH